MLFWLGAGADGAGADGGGAVVLAVVVVVVVLGVVVVEGLVDLFPPQPAVIAPSATTMTAPAITRVWGAVGDDVTIRSFSVADDRQERRQDATGRGAAPSRF